MRTYTFEITSSCNEVSYVEVVKDTLEEAEETLESTYGVYHADSTYEFSSVEEGTRS